MRSRETAGFRRGTDARLTRKEMEFDAEKTRQLAAHYKAIIELLGEDAGREGLLKTPAEAALARKLGELPGLLESCARDRAPFRLTHYAEELAGEFHSFYTVCQVLPGKGRPLDEALSHARLAACDATRRVLALTLELIGVRAPQSM